MHVKLDEIKKLESKPKVLKNFINKNEINKFLKLYEELPIAVNNIKQKVVKKRWTDGYGKELELLFKKRLKSEIGEFKMDNLITEDGKECFGLFQESYNPIGLHVDAGFNLDEIIFKQTLIPLTSKGSTVIFKNNPLPNDPRTTPKWLRDNLGHAKSTGPSGPQPQPTTQQTATIRSKSA